MMAPRLTRRAALGTGLAFTSVVCAGNAGAQGGVSTINSEQGFDALFVDATITMPTHLAAFIEASNASVPVVAINLDAAGFAQLGEVLHKSLAILGVSSGATLFCIEHIAHDHGFRLTRRGQRCASDFGDAACHAGALAFLGGADSAARLAPLCAYRPSRSDGLLHAWVLQKSGRSIRRQEA